MVYITQNQARSNNILYFCQRQYKEMYNQSNWLNIEEELYPQTLMIKIFSVQNQSAGVPIHVQVQAIYNSCHREINITDAVVSIVAQFYNSDGNYLLKILNPETLEYQSLATYPFKQPIYLKGSYIQCSHLKFQIESLNQIQEESKEKGKKKEKTVKEVLTKVGQWRKFYVENDKKINLEQAALKIGIPKNTLDDYYWQLKTAQKYGYDFKNNINQPFKDLKKFVKDKYEKKQKKADPVYELLQKYHPK